MSAGPRWLQRIKGRWIVCGLIAEAAYAAVECGQRWPWLWPVYAGVAAFSWAWSETRGL